MATDGSCVEVLIETTRILLDFGIPLVNGKGDDFNYYSKYSSILFARKVEEIQCFES